jgi:acetoin:2,6-dichlorophenolindophenol oxidoreductase subunit beta
MTVADTIRERTRSLLSERDGLLFGQCLTAVGWVQGTVPDTRGLVELPMNDVSGPSIAIGSAISGTRSVLVLRFQSLLWLAASALVNYAGKSRDIWNQPCPLMIRAIATDKGGPVHTNCFHNIFMHMPGFSVYAPMTPSEISKVWALWESQGDPFLVSEHRSSYKSDSEMDDIVHDEIADVTLLAISASRFNVAEVRNRLEGRGIKCNIAHIWRLKPFHITSNLRKAMARSRSAVVVDSSFSICGAQEHIACAIMEHWNVPALALGQEDRSAGIAPNLENGTPSVDKIIEGVEHVLKKIHRKGSNHARD